MTDVSSPYVYGEGWVIHELPMLPGLPPEVKLGGRAYDLKPELHCSLIKVARVADLVAERDHLSPEAAEKRAAEVCLAAVNKVKPKFDGYLNDVRLVDQPERDRHTIVVMASMTGLRELFGEVNRELGLELPIQAAHVTLFCENGLPIGIPGPEQLAKWTKPLTEQTRAELSSQLDPRRTFGWDEYNVARDEL